MQNQTVALKAASEAGKRKVGEEEGIHLGKKPKFDLGDGDGKVKDEDAAVNGT